MKSQISQIQEVINSLCLSWGYNNLISNRKASEGPVSCATDKSEISYNRYVLLSRLGAEPKPSAHHLPDLPSVPLGCWLAGSVSSVREETNQNPAGNTGRQGASSSAKGLTLLKFSKISDM